MHYEDHEDPRRLTCEICDSPQACLAGDCPCNLTGVFAGGPHAGRTIEDAAALDAAAAEGEHPLQDFELRGEHPLQDFELSIRLPYPTPELMATSPALAILCQEIVLHCSRKGTLSAEETNDRAQQLTQAGLKAHEALQDAVMEMSGNGTVSGAGMMTGAAVVVGIMLARSYHLAKIRDRLLKASMAKAFASYAFQLAADILDQMEEQSPTGGEPAAEAAADDQATALARKLAGG